jgi:hypothetical protein
MTLSVKEIANNKRIELIRLFPADEVQDTPKKEQITRESVIKAFHNIHIFENYPHGRPKNWFVNSKELEDLYQRK